MPRSDGFPTNQEMLVDFNAVSRDIFIAAYERQLESKISPAYQDKPLSLLSLCIARDKAYDPQAKNLNTVTYEQLDIRPLSAEDTTDMRSHLTMQHLPEDVLDHYGRMATHIGSFALNDQLRMSQALPPGSVAADYTAVLANLATHHIGTFKEKPAKPSIVAANYFAQEAAAYVQSDDFATPLREKLVDSLVEDRPHSSSTRHSFNVQFVPELPLNGYEPVDFLIQHLLFMERGLMRKQAILARYDLVGAPEFAKEPLKSQIAKYEDAIIRTRSILNSRY